jgi:hypothetical protein
LVTKVEDVVGLADDADSKESLNEVDNSIFSMEVLWACKAEYQE